MFEIDGSQKSGSGTILRLSIALSAITGQSLHIYNIRHKRPQPGLRPQHLEAVLTAAKLCKADTKGAVLESKELWFRPQKVEGGDYEAEIGTAGSIPMLLLTVLPICAFAKKTVHLHISKGGTDTQSAPTINYLRFVFLPALRKMGFEASIVVQKYGYYPKGMGEVTLIAEPHKLTPFRLEDFGNLKDIKGYSVCTFLADRKVAQRQANAAKESLARKGYEANIDVVNDTSNPFQKGSSIVLWAETDTQVILGADAIGELGKPSEVIGKEAAEKLCLELSLKPTVDTHLADMLIPYAGLAEGLSAFTTGAVSEHLETNIWLIEKMVGAKFNIEKVAGLFKIESWVR